MIRHVVLYSYRSDIPDEVINKIYEDLDKVSAKLPGRLSYSWGKTDGYDKGCKGYTHSLVMDFEDEKARELFMTDPERAALSKREVLPRMVGGSEGVVWLDFAWNK